MSNEGFDIVGRVIDETGPGVDSVKQSIGGLEQQTESMNTQFSQMGRTMSMLRGGAAVAGVQMMANQLAQSAEKAADLATKMRETHMSAAEISIELAEAIPIAGNLFAAGRRIGEALLEAVTGAEAYARMMHQADIQTRKVFDMSNDIREVWRSVNAIADDRTKSLMDEVDLLEALWAAETGLHETIRLEHREREEIAKLTEQQAADLEKMQEAMEKSIIELTQAGGDGTAMMLNTEEQIQALRLKHAEQLNEVQVRHMLDRAIKQRIEDEKAAEEAEREAEQMAVQAAREAEQQRREAERAAQQAARENERRMRDEAREAERLQREAQRAARDAAMEAFREQQSELAAMSSIAGRLAPGTRAGRFETGNIDTAREARQREVEREQKRLMEENKRLLERIASGVENIQTPQPVNI